MYKNPAVKSMMIPHFSIHKFIGMSPDVKIHNQIFNIMMDKGIQIYFMSDYSVQQNVTLTTIWWWQKLGSN
jgi:hypothetical protein